MVGVSARRGIGIAATERRTAVGDEVALRGDDAQGERPVALARERRVRDRGNRVEGLPALSAVTRAASEEEEEEEEEESAPGDRHRSRRRGRRRGLAA